MTAELGLSLEYLSSPAAFESIARDAYWPKWDAPWWHLSLLWELGEIKRAPAQIIHALIAKMNRDYLHFFPIRESELPSGTDPARDIPCHCQLGVAYQFLHAFGIDVDQELPWIRPWFLKYQIHDGGLNCDEAEYAKSQGRSSIISTLPPLEAVLRCTSRPWTADEEKFLDHGAEFLLSKSLFKRSNGAAVYLEWTQLSFPRFYSYDVLRGLSYVAEWAKRRHKMLEPSLVQDAIALIQSHEHQGQIVPVRQGEAGAKTRLSAQEMAKFGILPANALPADGSRFPALLFPLLASAPRSAQAAQRLTAQWKKTQEDLTACQ